MVGTQNIAVSTLLHRCQQLESAMARVYQELAVAHAYDAEISALWRKTAAEEDNHGMQFQLALNLGKDTIRDLRVDVDRVERALAKVRAYLTRVQAAPPGIQDALRETVALEEEMVDLHVSSMGRFEKESHRKLFAAMMAADKAHVGALRAALSRFEGRGR